MDLSRRTLLTGTLATSAAAAVALPARAADPSPGASLRVSPFTLGVASGDPTADGVVLWTRLAVDPVDESGTGAMPSRPVSVRYEVASDEGMRRIVKRGNVIARPESAHSVHVELTGLRPGAEYWYRFRTGQHISPVGRTRTAPAGHELPAALTMAFASCSQFEHGWFTAYRRLAEESPDLVLHLGDYQYEYKAQSYLGRNGNVRDHAGPETTDLATYRQRHAQYKSDPDLQAAHAAAPWLVVFDDHEVDNNWADEVPENTKAAEGNDTTARFRARRAAAFQAYWENMPLRRSSIPNGPDMQVFRRLQWGRLANFHMMDTRQYRDDQACGDGWKANCEPRLDPNRSITGARQEKWLLDGFKASKAQWDILGQQVFFAEQDRNASAGITDVSMDAWDGYAASRKRITQGWVSAGVRNPVVLTGDVHRHWANDLKVDYRDPEAPVVGSELVCTSITSTGNGTPGATNPNLAINPHLKYYADQRGYVSTTIRPQSMTADFKVLDAVTVKDRPVSTAASFELLDGQRGLRRKG